MGKIGNKQTETLMKIIFVKQLVFLMTFILYLCSCNFRTIRGYPINFEEEQVKHKYDSLEGGVQNLININGYYSCQVIRDLWLPDNAPYYTDGPESASLIFFDDGSFSWLKWKENSPLLLGFDNLNLSEHLKLKYPDFPIAGTIKDWRRKHKLCGGTYQIHGDTIIIEQTSVDYYSRDLSRSGFVVVDRNTIRMIFHEDVNKVPQYNRMKVFEKDIENDYTFHFHPATNLPSPVNTYDKNQKFRWNDRKKWKEYDRQRKAYLKTLK